MATISSAGVGSGLDVTSLVAQLVSAESTPVASSLARQQSGISLELSAFGQLRSAIASIDSALEGLEDVDALDGRSASSEDEDVFTLSAASGAAVGRFEIEIEQLAQGQRLSSTTAYASEDDAVGYGTLTFSLGGDSFNVEIDGAAQSLAEVRDAINNASDNPGVQATILNTDAGAILQFTSDRTGSDSEILMTTSGGDGDLANLIANMSESQAYADAIVYVDGHKVTSTSNTLDDVLDGVSISLNEARPGEVFEFSVSRDQSSAKSAMETFVQAYNSYVAQAQAMGGYDAESEVAGSLNGDSILRGANNQLRSALTRNYGGDDASLSAFGLELDVEGKLSIDDEALSAAVADDFSAFRNFLESDTGFIANLSSITAGYIDDDGIISGRVDSLNQRLESIEESADALDVRMERVEARYLAQFTALDVMLSQLQQTSSYLTQQLASLPGFSSSDG